MRQLQIVVLIIIIIIWRSFVPQVMTKHATWMN